MGQLYSRNEDSIKTLRLLTYNVEWGFLNIPDDIKTDSCGHMIPHTSLAQETHLTLISKNIGISDPDICFLQEIGSLQALQYIADSVEKLFTSKYSIYYSHGDQTGNQGVGVLIKSSISSIATITNIPNFKLDRGIGLTLTTSNSKYKLAGVHLKSLCDQKIQKDEKEQEDQIQAVLDWISDTPNAIICGDFNNVPESNPLQLMAKNGYTDTIAGDKYIPNIRGDTNTEFHGHSGKESGSRIDYIFVTNHINLVSSHIINFERECVVSDPSLRGESSDHLPVLAIIQM